MSWMDRIVETIVRLGESPNQLVTESTQKTDQNNRVQQSGILLVSMTRK